MKSGHRDLLKSQTNVEEEGTNKEALNFKGELLERDVIENTPFLIVGNKIDGYFLGFAGHRMGGVFETKDEVLDYLEREKWIVMSYLCSVICELHYNDKKNNEKLVANVENGSDISEHENSDV